MNLAEYNQFTQELRLKLAGDDRITALIALGSMAQQDYQPDEWSDHDFFVVTIHGVQEDMRQDLSWLPHADEIVFHFRETEHGLKVLYLTRRIGNNSNRDAACERMAAKYNPAGETNN